MDKSRNKKNRGWFVRGHPYYGKPKGFKCPAGSIAKMGEKNPNWGKLKTNPSYPALHEYIKKRLSKKQICEHCEKQKPLDMANKSHKYKRNLKDWLWLCRKCHQNYDGNHPPKGKLKGKKFSISWRKSLSEAHKGHIPWNKGKKLHYPIWNKEKKLKAILS